MHTYQLFSIRRFFLSLTLLAALLGLAACDQQRIVDLQSGTSTEGDVKIKFGEPEKIWAGAGGDRIFEYNRQPAGHVNYMITINPEGKMTALRQVLTPENFAKVAPGMMMEDVRKLLGKPAKITQLELKREIHYDWRYLKDNQSTIFTVYFDPDYRVLRTGSTVDPDAERK